MATNLNEALNKTNTVYKELVDIANDIVAKCTGDIDPIIKKISDNIENLSNDDIRKYELALSMKAWSFAEIKEKSAAKAEISKILQKEAYATEFNGAEGSVAVRENLANINISYEVLTATVNELVADILKVKLDEIHRIISVLQSVMLSRLSEAKLTQITDIQE